MKSPILVSLIVSSLFLPMMAAAQSYDENAETGDAAYFRAGGVGLKNPAFKERYYQFGKYLGAELGNAGNDLYTSYAFAPYRGNLIGVGTLPIGDKFSLFGKFGVPKSLVDYGQTTSSYLRERSSDLAYGIGLKYNYNPNLNLRFGWDRYNSGEEAYSGLNDVRRFSFGLGLKF
ncbi:MAG: outer membrane beta-barrel protein [Burkholderiales bacterium]